MKLICGFCDHLVVTIVGWHRWEGTCPYCGAKVSNAGWPKKKGKPSMRALP